MKNISEDQVKAPEEKKHTHEQSGDERPFTAAVITLSDKGAKGQRVVSLILRPSSPVGLMSRTMISTANTIASLSWVETYALARISITPSISPPRNAPGIAEYIRMCSARITDRAMLSRGVSVIRKGTLIINLPGSPKAVRESLGFILHGLDHGLRILRGSASECAAK